MEFALDDYLENSQRESLIETRGANAKVTGWYSIVLRVTYALDLPVCAEAPLYTNNCL